MKPARCFVCDSPANEDSQVAEGEWLNFSEYDASAAVVIGHPDGREYVCGQHLAAAKKLTHHASQEALVILQQHISKID